MQVRQDFIEMINILPQNMVEEGYRYVKYLKAQEEKDARNAEFLAKINRSIKQFAEGRGLIREIVEVEEEYEDNEDD
jgi:hypothetical protein